MRRVRRAVILALMIAMFFAIMTHTIRLPFLGSLEAPILCIGATVLIIASVVYFLSWK